MSSRPSGAAQIRSLGLSVYLPTFLFAVGQGAVIPIVPLAARELGASLAFASFVVALRGIGLLFFDVPAGWLVSRFGEGRAMTAGTLLVVLSLAGAIWSPSPIAFAAFTFLMGCSWSVWLLARLSYVTEAMPPELRGRALSTLGGVNRVGNFVGPFIGAYAGKRLGLDGAYYIHVATALAACAILVLLVRDDGAGRAGAEHGQIQLREIVRDHSRIFLTAGFGASAIGALRATRQSVLPLWAGHIGLDAASVSLLYGISMSMEMALFYPAGSLMDRYGRKAVALPCLAIMAIGMFFVPLTASFGSLLLVGLLIGFGNGLGAGIVMTLGADFSPDLGRAQFLGAWRLCADIGTAGGPVLVSMATALVSLGAGSVLMGAVGLAGAVVILLCMPESLQRAEGGGAPLDEGEPVALDAAGGVRSLTRGGSA